MTDEIVLRPLAVERANKEPLPGPVAVAFGPREDIFVGEIKVRPVIGGDFAIIKSLNSPVYRQILESTKEKGGEDIEPTDYEKWDIIYLLTHKPLECHALLQRSNDPFRQAAIEYVVGGEHSILTIVALFDACVEQFKRHLSTMIPYGSKEEGKEGESFLVVTPALAKTA